jgi:hypothetical protein
MRAAPHFFFLQKAVSVQEEQALLLWDAMMDYADDSFEVGAHGNSGEFHDPREYNKCARKRNSSLEKLKALFASATGFVPVLLKDEKWVLEKKASGNAASAGATAVFT